MDTLKLSQRKLNFVGSWFGLSLSCLLFSCFLLIYISTTRQQISPTSTYRLYQALPESQTQISGEIQKVDARSKIIENFFKEHNSLLAEYSGEFIEVADKYSLDYRLLPAIAMQESSGAKRVIEGSFNPFGYGIYGDKVLRFESWEDGIATVAKGLKENYIDQGLKTPYQIMTKYTPPSLEKGGAWAIGVNSFMSELK